MLVDVNGDHIEAHHAEGVLWLPGRKERRGADQLLLFAAVDRHPGRRVGAGAPTPDFDEHELFVVKCNQVDLAEPATEVAGERRKPVFTEIPLGGALGAST